MSNRTLRAIYAGMIRARNEGAGGAKYPRARQAASADVACWAAGVVGLGAGDLVFGCRKDGVLETLRGGASLPPIPDAVGRLYAAAGAAMTFRKGSGRVAMAFFERHEVGGDAWSGGLRAAAALALVLVVLPRWKGTDAEDLCAESRKTGVPGIAVDAADAIAVYRVAQESLVRARMGGGAALIEGVWFPVTGAPATLSGDPIETLATYLRRRGVASERWLQQVASIGVARDGMGVNADR